MIAVADVEETAPLAEIEAEAPSPRLPAPVVTVLGALDTAELLVAL